MLISLLKKANTVITVAGAIYTVSKFMFKTFKWYERNKGR